MAIVVFRPSKHYPDLGPKNPKGYTWRARVKAGAKDLKGAVADYDEAIRLTPNDSELFLCRGDARSGLGDCGIYLGLP